MVGAGAVSRYAEGAHPSCDEELPTGKEENKKEMYDMLYAIACCKEMKRKKALT
jgi:hypothetical protein